MKLTYSAHISGSKMVCDITSDIGVPTPVFCFSVMVPMVVVSGGTLVSSDAGYGEVQLPDLIAGTPHRVILRFARAEFTPANHAWLPMTPYLRHERGTDPLPYLAGRPLAGPAIDDRLPDGGLRLVPPPNQWRPTGGCLAITGVCADHPALGAVDALARRNGFDPFITPDGQPVVVKMLSTLPKDAYELHIGVGDITIHAGGRGGVVYAGITLLTLMQNHAGTVPCGIIQDAPHFDWRGQHLDCARHFFTVPTILQFLDLLALMKLNRFHWHFADDEAFRLELNCLPELAEKTAFRGEGRLMPGLFGGGICAGGSYSREDVRRIIAKALNIEIMPEIETMGHCLALTRVFPDMRDADDTGAEESIQGYAKNATNPAQAKTWQVLEAIIQEVAALFPFEMLHLGGDELAPNTWAGSAAVDQLKQQHGLSTPEDVHGWALERLARHVTAQGKRAGAWEEAAQGAGGGIGNNALLFSWTGQGPGIAAARAGYDVIMTPAQHTYFDMAASDHPDDWGANWAAYLPLENTIGWAPSPTQAQDITARVKGVQGAFWAELVTKDSQLWPMIWPRIMGLACKAWDAQDQVDASLLDAIAHAYTPISQAFDAKPDPN